ncbi:MAG: hypothetical protein Ct9H300mP1_06630 [Planctomycetaceae bacterium]|nr:MAG: hypothetical protein Ct9H300mP1_06630 [Planctomycetaceae bacterium]
MTSSERSTTGNNKSIRGFADGKRVHFLNINPNPFPDDDGKLPKSVMPDLLHPKKRVTGKWGPPHRNRRSRSFWPSDPAVG